MYIFLAFLVVALILILLAFKSQSKLEKEKAEGKWDFISDEFLPYLKSHTEPVKSTDELSFISYNGRGTTKFKGRLHYNSAGILIEQITKSTKMEVIEFFRGKDEPSKFKPLFESSLFNIQKSNDDVILNLKTSSIDRSELTIEKTPDYLFEELRSVLGSN